MTDPQCYTFVKHVNHYFGPPSVTHVSSHTSWVLQASKFILCLEANSSSHVEHEFLRRAGSESKKSPHSYSVGSVMSWALEAKSQNC